MGLFSRKRKDDGKVYENYQDVRKNAPAELNKVVKTKNGKTYRCTKLNVVPVWTAED